VGCCKGDGREMEGRVLYIIYYKVYAFLRLTEIKRCIKNTIKLKISLEKFW